MNRYLFILREGVASVRKYGICLFFPFGDLHYTFRNYMDIQEKIGSPGGKLNTCSSKTFHNQPADKAFGLDFFPCWCWMKDICRSAHKHRKLPVLFVVRNILPVQHFVAKLQLKKGLLIPEQLAGL